MAIAGLRRWQKEAMQQKPPKSVMEEPPCWEQKGCSPEQILACPAMKSTEPCWQTLRQSNGYLAQKCLDCQVFNSAPAPVKG